ncbi:hypothetical protein Hypma_000850 [Hypsizygus marmoreus]|uniref:NAD(P)-binding protein n=1 Tax=Hypsizygus marmoreus TaxID=39966 RepID=A0A369JGS0_HYPMA|nr:hypothetical protein Hypma_000850 [Hypsizygus marmoreus]
MIRSLADILAIGFLPFLAQAYFVGSPRWTPDDMPDQSGRIIIITGGNAGVGKECAKALLKRNAKVYLACRNQQKAEETINELRELTGNAAQYLHLDLADLKSVEAAVTDFTSKETRLDALMNNGGVMLCPMELNANGYDLQIHTNVLGHFYFTKLLLPVLLATAAEATSPKDKPRIINVSSSGHYLARSNPLDFNSFKCGPVRSKYSPSDMYTQSKFANIVFNNELAHRYGDKGLVCTAVNPGNLKTDLNRYVNTFYHRFALGCLQLYPASRGAITQLWAATAPEAAELNGKYLIPLARVGSPRADTQDPKLGKDLWEWMEEQVSSIHH